MEYIESKDVRDYCEKMGRVFTDFEKAALIYQKEGISHAEILKELEELRNITKDENLKKQIQERLEYEQECKRTFFENHEGMVYVLDYWDDMDCQYEEVGYYATAELAIKAAQREKEESYRIFRSVVVNSEMPEDEEHALPWAQMNLDENLECSYLYCSEVEEPGRTCGEARFEEVYIDIPYPFQNGDLVREIDTDLIGVVYDKGYEHTRDLMSELQEEGFVDYTDCSLVIEHPNEDAEFGHSHIRITSLEYANLSEDHPQKELLDAASRLLRGESSPLNFQIACEEYQRK